MDELKDRLQYALEKSGLNRATLAKKTGISRTNVVYLCSGRNKTTSFDNLQKLADALGVSFAWLAGNEGAQQIKPNEDVVIPFYDEPVFDDAGKVAGFVPSSKVHTYSKEHFESFNVSKGDCMCFTVTSDNMVPLLFPGDGVTVLTSDKTPWDHHTPHVYAIIIDRMLSFFRIRSLFDKVTIESINQNYPPITMEKSGFQEKASIIGRVIDRFGTGGL